MARTDPLIAMVDPAAIQSGIKPSLHKLSPPLWVDGENVNFSENKVWKARGFSSAFVKPGTTPIRGGAQSRISGIQNLFFGDQTTIHRWNTAVLSTPGTGFTGRVDDSASELASTWSMIPWGVWVIATNGKDVAQIWKGASFAALGGTDFTTAEILIKRGPFVLAINTSNGPNMVQWSDDDDPETWTGTPTNLAGNLIIRDMESEIMAAAPLGQAIAVYGRDSMNVINFVGAPFVFGFQPALNGIGCVGKAAVVADGRFNWGVSRQGIWRTDGQQFQYFDDPDIRRWLQDNVNWGQASKIVAYNNELRRRIEFFFPTIGAEPDVGWAISKNTGAWTKLGYGRTTALERNVFNSPILGHSDGSMFLHELGVDADGGALVASVQSKPFPLGNPHQWATIDEVVAAITDLTGVFEFRIGTQVRLDDAITWTPWQAVDESTDRQYPPFNTSGIYISIGFRSTDVGADWSLASFMIFGAGQGLDVDSGSQ